MEHSERWVFRVLCVQTVTESVRETKKYICIVIVGCLCESEVFKCVAFMRQEYGIGPKA